jgi:hypothetical protein
MEALIIEILNPKVKDILQRLADLKLISIKEEGNAIGEMEYLLKRLRSNTNEVLSLEDINKEVEYVRAKRYAGKTT